jgi:hypothetical protein
MKSDGNETKSVNVTRLGSIRMNETGFDGFIRLIPTTSDRINSLFPEPDVPPMRQLVITGSARSPIITVPSISLPIGNGQTDLDDVFPSLIMDLISDGFQSSCGTSQLIYPL